MISKLPWYLDEENPSIIYDADRNIIAEKYTFIHIDDFESICKMANSLDAKRYRWLRWKYAAGKETYLAEEIMSEQQLDEYIDRRKNND